MRMPTFKRRLQFMIIILLLCSTPSDAPDGQNCALHPVYTIQHAKNEPPGIRTHKGRMDRCTETGKYPCWRFYPERKEIEIIGNQYEDFVGLTIDGNAVDELCVLRQICERHCDTIKGKSNHTQLNCTESNSTECSYTGLIITIVFLVILVILLAIALVIALVLLVIAVKRPHVIPNLWNRCTRRRTQSSDTESNTQSPREGSNPSLSGQDGNPNGTEDQPNAHGPPLPEDQTEPSSETESQNPRRRIIPSPSMQRDTEPTDTPTTGQGANAGGSFSKTSVCIELNGRDMDNSVYGDLSDVRDEDSLCLLEESTSTEMAQLVLGTLPVRSTGMVSGQSTSTEMAQLVVGNLPPDWR